MSIKKLIYTFIYLIFIYKKKMGFKIFENNLLIIVMLNLHFSLIYCCFPSQKYAYHLFSLAIKVINKDNGYKTNFI